MSFKHCSPTKNPPSPDYNCM